MGTERFLAPRFATNSARSSASTSSTRNWSGPTPSTTAEQKLFGRPIENRWRTLFNNWRTRLGRFRAMLEHCIHVHVTVSQDARTQEVARISEETTEVIQNQLLRYRSEHLPEVSKLELHAAGLSPDFNAIASALGECIVSAPELQSELLSLLESLFRASDRRASRWSRGSCDRRRSRSLPRRQRSSSSC